MEGENSSRDGRSRSRKIDRRSFVRSWKSNEEGDFVAPKQARGRRGERKLCFRSSDSTRVERAANGSDPESRFSLVGPRRPLNRTSFGMSLALSPGDTSSSSSVYGLRKRMDGEEEKRGAEPFGAQG